MDDRPCSSDSTVDENKSIDDSEHGDRRPGSRSTRWPPQTDIWMRDMEVNFSSPSRTPPTDANNNNNNNNRIDLKRPDLKGAFRCSICQKIFCHSSSLSRHRMQAHFKHYTCGLCLREVKNFPKTANEIMQNPAPLRSLPLTTVRDSTSSVDGRHVAASAPLTPTGGPGGGGGPRPQSPYVGLTADCSPVYDSGRLASTVTASSIVFGVQRHSTTADHYSTLFPLNVHRISSGNNRVDQSAGVGDQRYSKVDNYRKSIDNQPVDTQSAQISPKLTDSTASSLVSSASTSPLPPYHSSAASSASSFSSSTSSSQRPLPQGNAAEERNKHANVSLYSNEDFAVPKANMTSRVCSSGSEGGGGGEPTGDYASERNGFSAVLSSFRRQDNGFELLPTSTSDSTPQDYSMEFGMPKPSLAVDRVVFNGDGVVLNSADKGSFVNEFAGGGDAGPTNTDDIEVDVDADMGDAEVLKKRKKKPYKELTLEEKVELIRLAERNSSLSQASIAERYSIAKSNVCRILQRRVEYLRAYESAGFAGSRKRKLRGSVGAAANAAAALAPSTESESMSGGERAPTTENAQHSTHFSDRTSSSSSAVNATAASSCSELFDDKLTHFQKGHSRYSESVRIHMYKQHQVSRTFTCRCCNFAFADKTALRAHLQAKLEAKVQCGAKNAKSTFKSYSETTRKAVSTFGESVKYSSAAFESVEQPKASSGFVPPPSIMPITDMSDGPQSSSSCSSSSSSVALLRALLLANGGVGVANHENSVDESTTRMPPVPYALEYYSKSVPQQQPQHQQLWKSSMEVEPLQSHQHQLASPSMAASSFVSPLSSAAQPPDFASHIKYGHAPAATAADAFHPPGAMLAVSTLLMMHATAMRTGLPHCDPYAAANFAATATATGANAAEPTQGGLLSIWQSLVEAQQRGGPPPDHANAMSTEPVGNVPPDYGAFPPSAFRSVGNAGPFYSVLSEPHRQGGVIVEAVTAKSAERQTTATTAETGRFAVNVGVEEEFVGQQDSFGRDSILDLSKAKPNVDHSAHHHLRDDVRHHPNQNHHHHQIVVDPCELSSSASDGSPSSSSTSHHNHHSSTSSSTTSPVVVVVNGGNGDDVDASQSLQHHAANNRADYGHTFVAGAVREKRKGDCGGGGDSNGIGGSSGGEVSTVMALMSRCNHLEVCNFSLQNEMLRAQRCAQKLEGELERLRDRTNLLQFKLLECREKALFVMQLQRKSARSDDEPNNNNNNNNSNNNNGVNYADDENMMTRLYERMSDFVGDILRITFVK